VIITLYISTGLKYRTKRDELCNEHVSFVKGKINLRTIPVLLSEEEEKGARPTDCACRKYDNEMCVYDLSGKWPPTLLLSAISWFSCLSEGLAL
jgi:hypothetical protein